MLKYKIDVLEALKEKGYSTYVLRQQNIIGQATITSLNNGKSISWHNIDKICELLECQPADFLEYVPNKAHEPHESTDN